MFLLRPADLLELLRIVSNPRNRYATGALPPDAKPVDAFFDGDQNYLGLMLESELFEEVDIELRDGRMYAAWPRAVFALERNVPPDRENDEMWMQGQPGEEVAEPAPIFMTEFQAAAERGLHLRALNFSPDDLMTILRSDSPSKLPVFPVYPPETHILGSIANDRSGGWTVFLEHPDFDTARVYQEEDVVYAEIEGDGHDMSFRFALPGAKLQKRHEIDPNALQ